MNAEKELSDWNRYHNASVRHPNTRAGQGPGPIGIPGPPMTPDERSMEVTLSPTDKNGWEILPDY